MTNQPLERAREGDETAFAELTEPFRRELHVHCYRMLGSVDDADDLLQETLLAAWRGVTGFAERASVRTWLYTIATRRCLNAIRNADRRPRPAPRPPFAPPEPTAWDEIGWLQPYPTRDLDPATAVEIGESLQLAFIATLQRTPPRQAAALLLADVLGFSTAEIAAMLDAGPTTIKGLLQRARAAMSARSPAERGTRVPDSDDQRVAERFAEAFSRDDVDAVVALLTDQAWLSMPPAPHAYRGRDAVRGFLRASARHRSGRHFRLLPVAANGQTAFACYLSGETFLGLDATAPKLQRATGVIVLTSEGGRITAITHFLDPELYRLFDLPETVPTEPR